MQNVRTVWSGDQSYWGVRKKLGSPKKRDAPGKIAGSSQHFQWAPRRATVRRAVRRAPAGAARAPPCVRLIPLRSTNIMHQSHHQLSTRSRCLFELARRFFRPRFGQTLFFKWILELQSLFFENDYIFRDEKTKLSKTSKNKSSPQCFFDLGFSEKHCPRVVIAEHVVWSTLSSPWHAWTYRGSLPRNPASVLASHHLLPRTWLAARRWAAIRPQHTK